MGATDRRYTVGMGSTSIRYCQTIHNQFSGFYAAWPPNAALTLGDFGYVRDGVFDRKSNLSTCGLKWKTRPGRGQATYSLTTGSGTSMRVLARGEIGPGGVPVAKAQADVSFSASDSVFFNAAGCTVDEIEDQVGLGNQLLQMFAQRQWNDDWYIVTRIVQATSSTIAVSQSAGASLRLEAKGDDARLDLADARLGLVATHIDQVTNLFVSEDGLTPLIGLSRVRRRILKGPVFGVTEEDAEDTLEVRERLRHQGTPVQEIFEFAESA